jgi:hypothetical protein
MSRIAVNTITRPISTSSTRPAFCTGHSFTPSSRHTVPTDRPYRVLLNIPPPHGLLVVCLSTFLYHTVMPRNDTFEMSDIVSNNSGRDTPDDSALAGSKHLNGNASTRRRSLGVASFLDDNNDDEEPITAAETKEAERGFLRSSITIGILIASWYLFSISITVVRPPTQSL